MSMNTAAKNSLLGLLLNNNDWTNVGDAAGLQASTTAGVVYVSLHSADPSGGDATTSELSYTGYARVSVARSAAGWTVAAGAATNAAATTFAACTAGSGSAVYAGVSDTASGASNWLVSGALTATLAISAGITPSFALGALSVTAT